MVIKKPTLFTHRGSSSPQSAKIQWAARQLHISCGFCNNPWQFGMKDGGVWGEGSSFKWVEEKRQFGCGVTYSKMQDLFLGPGVCSALSHHRSLLFQFSGCAQGLLMLLQRCSCLFTQGCSVQLWFVGREACRLSKFLKVRQVWPHFSVMIKSDTWANLTPLLMCVISTVLHGN